MSRFGRNNSGLLNQGKRKGGLFGGGPHKDKPAEDLFREKDKSYLRVLDLLKAFFVNRGIDYEQLRLLVKVKMTVNERTTIKESQKQGQSQASFGLTLFVQLFLGIISAMMLLMPGSVSMRYMLAYSLLFLMMTITLVAQLAQILLSTEDLLVLPVRPIAPNVLNMSRLIQVMIYQLTAFLTYALPTVIIGYLVFDPLTGTIALLSTVFLSLFILLLALALYLLAARYFSGDKLRDMITYLQIVMVVLMTVGYQFAGEFIPQLVLQGQARVGWWTLLIPTYWFASAPALLSEGLQPALLIGTALMLASVIVLSIFYFKNAAFLERRLVALAQDKGGDAIPKTRLRDFFARLLCRDETERNYFRFSWQMMKHERSFKSATYPALAMYNILPYVFVVTIFIRPQDNDPLMGDSPLPWHIMLYMVLLILPVIFGQLQSSDYHEASWVFRLTPGKQDGAYARALAKAVWARLLAPAMLLHTILLTAINGLSGLTTALNLLALSYILSFVLSLTLPMTRPFTKERTVRESQGCGTMLIILPVIFILAVAQVVTSALNPWISLIWTAFLTLCALALMFVFRPQRRYRDAS